ncbi:MAG: PLP-dependent aminotransferase family protein [Candidatus Tectomicrobia bacterium]|nr:PLP-dependent aminotransferase family protein [Candidatus Tectomicrobia bacterium]
MFIQIDRGSSESLYSQITGYLRHLIETDMLKAGVKLPSTRQLAADIGVDRTTVTAAYDELIAEGLAIAHVGQGTFVAVRELQGEPRGNKVVELEPVESEVNWSQSFSKVARASTEWGQPEFPTYQVSRGAVSFGGGMPDSSLFPIDAFRQVLNQVLRAEGEKLLQYSPVSGYPPLRRYLAEYLVQKGIGVSEDDILIVNGSQQGLDLVARTLLDPGDQVVVEGPSYPGALQIFRSYQAEMLTIPIGEDGLRRDLLEGLLQRHAPKFIYVIPTFQNPTGVTISLEGRKGLLDIAAKFQVPIVEDDFHNELRYEGSPVIPIRGLDRKGRVIAIGTFSKILFPGLRVGWVVAPPEVMERLIIAKRVSDLHTSALIQAAIYHFCRRRLLDRHMMRVRVEYRRRRDTLLAALQRYCPPEVTWTQPQGGFSLLLTLPRGLDSQSLLAVAAHEGVLYTPGSLFYADGKGRNQLRLSFSDVSPARIEEGVQRLAKVIEAALRNVHRQGPSRRGESPPLV